MPETDRRPGLDADLALIRDAAREAAGIAMRFFRNQPEVWMKTGQSPVSEADMAVDLFLKDALLGARPQYGWLSEETADTPARLSAARTFVVDPIDGTRAFIEGRDTWCVSIAVVEDGRPLAGVLDCPARGEIYSAESGRGADCNGGSLRVDASAAVLKVAGPKPMVRAMPADWQARIEIVPHVPSLAYRIAMIASGALAGTFVKPNSHDWDIAAAALILREAGGRLLDPSGREPAFAGMIFSHGPLVAGSGPLLEAMAASIGTSDVPKPPRMD